MTSLLRVDDVDVLSLDFSKVSFDDDVDVKEYETIEKESNVQKRVKDRRETILLYWMTASP